MPPRSLQTHILIETKGREITVEVTRKRVKNLNLRVRHDGTVALSIPPHCPLSRAREFAERKADWIVTHVLARERQAHGSFLGAKSESSGKPNDKMSLPAYISLWGAKVDMLEALGLDERAAGPLSPSELHGRVLDLYKREVTCALPQIAEGYERLMGVHAERWSIRTMKTRWGSCTPKTRAIRINARLAAYPRVCLEFVVAHELTHLLEPSHNARFHALIDQFCPENRTAATLLKKDAGRK